MGDEAITIVWNEPEKRCETCGCQLILTDCLICYENESKTKEKLVIKK